MASYLNPHHIKDIVNALAKAVDATPADHPPYNENGRCRSEVTLNFLFNSNLEVTQLQPFYLRPLYIRVLFKEFYSSCGTALLYRLTYHEDFVGHENLIHKLLSCIVGVNGYTGMVIMSSDKESPDWESFCKAAGWHKAPSWESVKTGNLLTCYSSPIDPEVLNWILEEGSEVYDESDESSSYDEDY